MSRLLHPERDGAVTPRSRPVSDQFGAAADLSSDSDGPPGLLRGLSSGRLSVTMHGLRDTTGRTGTFRYMAPEARAGARRREPARRRAAMSGLI